MGEYIFICRKNGFLHVFMAFIALGMHDVVRCTTFGNIVQILACFYSV